MNAASYDNFGSNCHILRLSVGVSISMDSFRSSYKLVGGQFS